MRSQRLLRWPRLRTSPHVRVRPLLPGPDVAAAVRPDAVGGPTGKRYGVVYGVDRTHLPPCGAGMHPGEDTRVPAPPSGSGSRCSCDPASAPSTPGPQGRPRAQLLGDTEQVHRAGQSLGPGRSGAPLFTGAPEASAPPLGVLGTVLPAGKERSNQGARSARPHAPSNRSPRRAWACLVLPTGTTSAPARGPRIRARGRHRGDRPTDQLSKEH